MSHEAQRDLESYSVCSDGLGSCCGHEPILFLRYLLAAWRLIRWLRILVSSGLMTRSTLGKEWNELPTEWHLQQMADDAQRLDMGY